MNGDDHRSAQFLKDIRKYNGALHLTSLGAKQRQQTGWNPSFVLHGQIYHRMGNLLPEPGESARFCQVFFIDQELQGGLQWTEGLNAGLLAELQAMLHECNGYVRSLKTAVERLQEDPRMQNARLVINCDARPAGEHLRRFNLPECSEVSILADYNSSDGEVQSNRRDIVLRLRGGGEC